MMIDNYLEPERIISYNEGRMITKKEYDILKRRALVEKERIENQICMGPDGSYINQKIIENNITNTQYDDLSVIKKEVMLANAILPDDIKIIDILSENGFTLDHIKTIIKFRGILKNLVIYNKVITDELREQINIYKKVIKILIDIFRENFNVDNSTIILNKICELLVTSPELFETRTNINKLVK